MELFIFTVANLFGWVIWYMLYLKRTNMIKIICFTLVLSVVELLLIVLKILGLISCSWLIVFLPSIITIGMSFIWILIVLLMIINTNKIVNNCK